MSMGGNLCRGPLSEPWSGPLSDRPFFDKGCDKGCDKGPESEPLARPLIYMALWQNLWVKMALWHGYFMRRPDVPLTPWLQPGVKTRLGRYNPESFRGLPRGRTAHGLGEGGNKYACRLQLHRFKWGARNRSPSSPYESQYAAGFKRNSSSPIPWPPTSSFRNGLQVLENASMPGRLARDRPLFTSMGTTLLP